MVMLNKIIFHITFFPFLIFSSICFAQDNIPELSHAVTYEDGVDVSEYLVSEKLDGVRAFWDGEHLISRQGNFFNAPEWFVADFPPVQLDGELWVARNRFEDVVSIVRKKTPVDSEWRNVKYMVFELPRTDGTFAERYDEMKSIAAKADVQHLRVIEQYSLSDSDALQQKLNEVVSAGGEGLMLHRADSLYVSGRTGDIVKVKKHYDAEATVLEHIPGKGKYTNMLGSLLVENEEGVVFKIGTGFSDAERADPPPIGTLITYKYMGKTERGVPRFASFLRVRSDLDI